MTRTLPDLGSAAHVASSPLPRRSRARAAPCPGAVAAAFLEEEQRHAQLLKSSSDFGKPPPAPPQSPGIGLGGGRKNDDDSEVEFEDIEEDVLDREALKRHIQPYSHTRHTSYSAIQPPRCQEE